MAECPSCGQENAPGARECASCGAPVTEATQQFEAVHTAEADKETSVVSAGPALFVRKGPETGDTFFLETGRLTVGRDPASDIFLNDVTVSREHAIIDCDENSCEIIDAGSLNGTYVNGNCVERCPLAEGDVVQVGAFQMVFMAGGGPG